MRQREPRFGELLLWSALGAGAGLVAGLAASAWFGRATRANAGATVRALASARRADTRRRAEAGRRAGQAARAAQVALAADPELARCGLACLPVGQGEVELHGWVPSRTLRARAVRLVRDVPGLDTVINAILVHGEDDREPSPETQTA